MHLSRRLLGRAGLTLMGVTLLALPLWAAVGLSNRPSGVVAAGGTSTGSGFRLFGVAGQPVVGTSVHSPSQTEVQAGRFFVRPWATAVEPPSNLPAEHRLLGNHPNPFNPRTTVRYELASPAPVRITVHDVRGRLVTTLVDESQLAGAHAVNWSGEDRRGRAVPSGTYFLRLSVDGQVQTHKMTLLK